MIPDAVNIINVGIIDGAIVVEDDVANCIMVPFGFDKNVNEKAARYTGGSSSLSGGGLLNLDISRINY